MAPGGTIPSEDLDTVLETVRLYYADENNTFRFREYRAIVGFLFAPPRCQIAKDTIIPSLNYYDLKSGDSMDLFCIGYTKENRKKDRVLITKIGEQEWFFDDKAFHVAVNAIESRTKWSYSGEVDLLIANIYDDPGNYVHFDKVLSFDIEKMVKNGAIESTNKLFQAIFNFAENVETGDPVREFSNKMGYEVANKSLQMAFWEWIKKVLFLDLKGMPDFAVRDVTK